ncbi:MAG: hypothetical protein JWO32_373 [Bacteroidetes bacterium]|nr:hypothetical protein [Bacteroidota bacterium]
MKEVEYLLQQIEGIEFSGNQKCIEKLDNRLQDLIRILTFLGQKASSEWIALKDCSWTLHERYHMDSEENLKWTFHHSKHNILKNGTLILNARNLKIKKVTSG